MVDESNPLPSKAPYEATIYSREGMVESYSRKTPELPEELNSRLKREEWKAIEKHLTQVFFLIVFMVAFTAAGFICISPSDPAKPPDPKLAERAWQVVLMILSAAGGYIAGARAEKEIK